MVLAEYDEEKVLRNRFKEGRDEGLDEGRRAERREILQTLGISEEEYAAIARERGKDPTN